FFSFKNDSNLVGILAPSVTRGAASYHEPAGCPWHPRRSGITCRAVGPAGRRAPDASSLGSARWGDEEGLGRYAGIRFRDRWKYPPDHEPAPPSRSSPPSRTAAHPAPARRRRRSRLWPRFVGGGPR